MTYTLKLPEALRQQGWQVKIRNLERVEPPHVTIMRKTQTWRYGLREPGFLDSVPNPRDVPTEVVDVVNAKMEELRAEWDRRYPENPVLGCEDEDGRNE